jgi:hypothetical protein
MDLHTKKLKMVAEKRGGQMRRGGGMKIQRREIRGAKYGGKMGKVIKNFYHFPFDS